MNERSPLAPFRVLVVDDEQLFAQAIGREVERLGVACDLAYTAADALRMAELTTYQLFLLDHKLPDDDGIRIIPLILSRQPAAALVMMTAFETIPNAVAAIRQGAEDYLVKQTNLKPIVEKVKEVRSRVQARESRKGWDDHERSGLIGDSPAILRAIAEMKKVAQSPQTTVLLTGESGVGKEVAAQYLHRLSCGENAPFMPVDCVALPATLIENILFGHEKGAVAGADRAADGVLAKAGAGTVFLDGIGELGTELQGRLLRVLETRTFNRTGSSQEEPLRSRIVASTHRDLSELVAEGRFRFDLSQRLAVFPIAIPPLRERREDIPSLTRHFIEFTAQKLGHPSPLPLSAEIDEILRNYDYPGNVRELKNIIERAMVLADGAPLGARHFPERIQRIPVSSFTIGSRKNEVPVDFIPGVDSLETLEKKMIVNALRQTKGARSAAAELLGISRFQLLRRIEKYGLGDTGEE